jgi:hypothetical protein
VSSRSQSALFVFTTPTKPWVSVGLWAGRSSSTPPTAALTGSTSTRSATIVFHCQEDQVVPFDEGRLLAASIRGAKFVPLPIRNHLILEHEPAWQIFLRELGEFLGWEHRGGLTVAGA